jgi:hypothetical protein
MANESIQCSVCGQWKRLTRTTGPDSGMQTFYPCCGDKGQYDHAKPVCDECCKVGCPYDPNSEMKGVVRIYNISWARGHGLRGKHGNFWCADKDGDVIDYHYKKTLIESAKTKGEKYAVLRHHKGGGRSIVEKNY